MMIEKGAEYLALTDSPIAAPRVTSLTAVEEEEPPDTVMGSVNEMPDNLLHSAEQNAIVHIQMAIKGMLNVAIITEKATHTLLDTLITLDQDVLDSKFQEFQESLIAEPQLYYNSRNTFQEFQQTPCLPLLSMQRPLVSYSHPHPAPICTTLI
ncbi:hypothetical protein FISHEDRAFT_61857 [Fistulina hepatica ATCC 64428]|uniref:Uncharacterized protein n=1 Tax=Fistulina hepatica ATCC 64428 TaxID=1128425 RepID=A0A0D7A0J7_9AGAR|nr:hypothetical protein FISHEDRAFT_61857 [Fistulina hepatica ATCC 64428]